MCMLVALLKDVKRIESVQRRCTKRPPSMDHLSYANRLRAVGFDTLVHRWLRQDLLHTYKVLFDKSSIDHSDMFCASLQKATNQRKLYPNFHRTNLCRNFFCERVIPLCNNF